MMLTDNVFILFCLHPDERAIEIQCPIDQLTLKHLLGKIPYRAFGIKSPDHSSERLYLISHRKDIPLVMFLAHEALVTSRLRRPQRQQKPQ